MVMAATNFSNPQILADVSEDLGEAMVGVALHEATEKWAARESSSTSH